MTIGESSDGVWRRDEVTRCRFFLRFCYRFFNRLRLARMHCERLRSAMGASSEAKRPRRYKKSSLDSPRNDSVVAAAASGGRILGRLPLRTAAATPFRAGIPRLTLG